MYCELPQPDEITDLSIKTLGTPQIPCPMKNDLVFIEDSDNVLVYQEYQELESYIRENRQPPMFQAAGLRKKIFFDPSKITCGIVNCGGICPGLNDVIRTITLSLHWQYGVKKVLGFRYGYEGLSSNARKKPMILTPDVVDSIQHDGGTILGSSRGEQDVDDMINILLQHDISILFVIGGDGTFRGAHQLALEIEKRRLSIAIIGVPKTIDNDIYCCESSFGFNTAVEAAQDALVTAHNEARAAWYGIGLVKLMGRDSGFIASHATLANSDVNFCLIPEVPFQLDGPDGLFNLLKKRLTHKHHAVIVVAEGAGQDLIEQKGDVNKDASGNIKYKDIGIFLKEQISDHFKTKQIPITVKYIDPSYMIRSCPANAQDSAFCLMLGQNAVHAGMAGKTDMFIGYWKHNFTHVPLAVAVKRKQRIAPCSILWQTVKETTRPNLEE